MESHCLPKLMFFTHCVKRPPPPLCFTQSCCGFFDITVEKCVSVCCDKLPHNSAKISGKNVKSTLKFYPLRFFFCVNLRLAEGTQCRKVKKMQLVWLYILVCKRFEDSLKNTLQKNPNKCYQCDFASSGAGYLGRHLKTHSGEKSNKCNQCDYASSQASNLRAQLKAHSGEKSNKCNQCDFASSYASALRIHLKIHSGEKSNKCYQCDFASAYLGNLRGHLKAHSGEKSKQMQLMWLCIGLCKKVQIFGYIGYLAACNKHARVGNPWKEHKKLKGP